MQNKDECLSETDIGALLEGRAAPGTLERARKCAEENDLAFAELVAACRVLDSEETVAVPEVPSSLLEKARAVFPAETGLFDVVLGFARDAFKVVQCLPQINVSTPAPAFGLRSTRAVSPNMITFTKKFRELDIELDIERTSPELCAIKAVLREPGSKTRRKGLRISLFSGDRELASALASQGETMFEDVHPGEYTIVVTRGRTRIADTALKLMK